LSGGLAELASYLASPPPETVLVLVAADLARNTRIGKQVLKTATVVEFWGLKTEREARGSGVERALQAAVRLVQERVQQAGFRIGPDVIEVLVEHAGTDIAVLRGDLERLILFCSGRAELEITSHDAAAVVSGTALVNHWAVTNAIEGRDTAQALRQLAVQLDEGISPHLILGQLRWFVSEKMAVFAPARVGPAVEALFRTDNALKSSGGDPQVLLERLVVELCSGGDRRYALRGP
jgi:DNA polymerase III delta subunit